MSGARTDRLVDAACVVDVRRRLARNGAQSVDLVEESALREGATYLDHLPDAPVEPRVERRALAPYPEQEAALPKRRRARRVVRGVLRTDPLGLARAGVAQDAQRAVQLAVVAVVPALGARCVERVEERPEVVGEARRGVVVAERVPGGAEVRGERRDGVVEAGVGGGRVGRLGHEAPREEEVLDVVGGAADKDRQRAAFVHVGAEPRGVRDKLGDVVLVCGREEAEQVVRDAAHLVGGRLVGDHVEALVGLHAVRRDDFCVGERGQLHAELRLARAGAANDGEERRVVAREILEGSEFASKALQLKVLKSRCVLASVQTTAVPAPSCAAKVLTLLIIAAAIGWSG